ncbi:MAG TPA: hypothetical protein VG389_21900 [Myxococcota bacterium]|nr:hypothetical protein [Myxococcota bacterium]
MLRSTHERLRPSAARLLALLLALAPAPALAAAKHKHKPKPAAAPGSALAPATAPAPAAATAPDESGTPRTAREWFAKGSVHHKVGEFALAIEAYKTAYKLEPAAVYLYNVALAYGSLGNDAEALRYYQLYLADDPDSPLRADVEARMAELEKRLKAAAAPPATSPATEPAVASPALTPPPPAAAPSRHGGAGVAIGLGVGVGAVLVAGAVVTLVLFLMPAPVDATVGEFNDAGRVVVDFRSRP